MKTNTKVAEHGSKPTTTQYETTETKRDERTIESDKQAKQIATRISYRDDNTKSNTLRETTSTRVFKGTTVDESSPFT